MRALVVEDETTLREGLRAQLVEQGFTVDVAADGNEGLFAGTEYPLDIAVIDLGLPKLSGLDLIRSLRKAGKKFPILILTARDRWQDKVEGLQAALTTMSRSPFTSKKCWRACRRCCAAQADGPRRYSNAGPIRLDTRAQSVSLAGLPIELTTFEYRSSST
jgi:two-component system response regulator PhoP